MGVCASSSNSKGEMKVKGNANLNNDSIKVVHMVDGFIEEFNHPIQAFNITSRNPNFVLCNSEQMLIGSRLPSLAAADNLQIGQIYFLLPHSLAQSPLSLPHLCNFAITASSSSSALPISTAKCSFA